MDHLLEVVDQQFGSPIVAIAYMRHLAARTGHGAEELEHHPQALNEWLCNRNRAFAAHQQQRGCKKLRDQYLIPGGSLVIPSVFVYLLCHFSLDSPPVFPAPGCHALAIEEDREAVKPHYITQIVIASQ